MALGPAGLICGGDTRGRFNVFTPEGKVVQSVRPDFIQGRADPAIVSLNILER